MKSKQFWKIFIRDKYESAKRVQSVKEKKKKEFKIYEADSTHYILSKKCLLNTGQSFQSYKCFLALVLQIICALPLVTHYKQTNRYLTMLLFLCLKVFTCFRLKMSSLL